VATTYCHDIDDAIERRKASSITTDRHSKIGPKELAKEWNVGLETAKNTMQVTTQNGVRTAVHHVETSESGSSSLAPTLIARYLVL
jgi:hypothetical protein